jgi:hypothetical protein
VNGVEIVGAARRHPAILIGMLLLTIAAAFGTYKAIPVTYKAETKLIFLAPGVSIDGNGKRIPINPWSVLGDNAAQVAASALASVANGTDFQSVLGSKGVTSATTIAVDTSGGGGVVLDVDAVNKVAETAVKDMNIVVGDLQHELLKRQQAAGAPSGTSFSAQPLTADSVATPVSGGRSKVGAVAGVLGLIVTLVTLLIVDARSRRRRAAADPRNDSDSTSTRPSPRTNGAVRRGRRRTSGVAATTLGHGPLGAVTDDDEVTVARARLHQGAAN